MNTYTYEYGDNLYINLSNTCTNDCVFCIRRQEEIMGGLNLWLSEDATAKQVIDDLEKRDLSQYQMIVFCGYGEPTSNINALVEVGKYLRTKDVKVKLNTNGQGSLYHGRDIVPEIAPYIDVISISLNEKDAESYQKVSCSEYGEKSYEAVVEFIRESVKLIPKVVVTVVDIIPDDHIDECRRIAAELGAEIRVREYTQY